MSQHWLIGKLDAVEAGADAVLRAMSEVSGLLGATRDELDAGAPFVTLAKGLAERGAEPRRLAAAAFQDYERAVADLRAAVVWTLVEQEGVPLSVVAREMGISRQAATRIYKAGGRMELSTSRDESP